MNIITGDTTTQRVRQVVVTDLQTSAPGWVLYAELRSGRVVDGQQVVTALNASGQLHFVDVEGKPQTVSAARIWRAGKFAALPPGGVAVGQSTDYPVTTEMLITNLDLPVPDYEHPVYPASPADVRRYAGDFAAVFPRLWTSPRTLTRAQEDQALELAVPPSTAVCCSVRPDNRRWTYATGKERELRQWGAVDLQSQAKYLATARMHAAWVAWHDQVLAAAGGRTDWLGGLQLPGPCKVFALDGKQVEHAGQQVEAGWPVLPGDTVDTQVALRQLIERYSLSRQQVANLLGVSIISVHNWLRPISNQTYRRMPDNQLELLRRLLVEHAANSEATGNDK